MTEDARNAQRKSRISKALRALRGPRTLKSQAEKMGLSRQRYGEWERGDIPDSVLAFVRLAEAEGVGIEELLPRNGS